MATNDCAECDIELNTPTEFPGKSMQPAAKKGDSVLGVDVHIVMVPSPGGPVPTPLPHPFSGTLDNGLSEDVKIEGQFAAMVDSEASNGPSHIPTPPGTAFQNPPSNKASVFMGSATVYINGKPAARSGDPCMTCNDPVDLPAGAILSTTSSVVIGGPPSQGSASAEGESAGEAQGDAGQSTQSQDAVEAEKDYVEFEVVGTDGDPIEGLAYELVLPDGETKDGTLGNDGSVREEEISRGTASLRLQGLHDARWNASLATVDEDIELLVDAARLEGSVTFEVYREFQEGPNDCLERLSGTIDGGQASASWKYSFDERDEGTSPRFVFHAVSETFRVISPPLRVGHTLCVEVADEAGAAITRADYQLIAADGERRNGVTDGEGRLEERGLAFGPCQLELTNGCVIQEVN